MSKGKVFKVVKRLFNIFVILFFASSSYAVELSFEFKDVPVKDVLTYVTKMTGQTFLYNGDDKTFITWEKSKIPQKNLVPEFQKVLQVYGFEVGRENNTIIVKQPSGYILDNSIAVYQSKWVLSQDLVRAITDVWQDVIKVSGFGKVVLIYGSESNIKKVLSVLSEYDRPVVSAVTKFPLSHIKASDAYDILKLDTELVQYVIPDSWSNSLLIRGDARIRIVLGNYVRKIDVVSNDEIKKVITLSGELSDDLVLSVQQLFPTLHIFGVGNKIILSGISDRVSEAISLINQIDGVQTEQKNSQVIVKAVISSLTDRDYSELSLKLGYLAGDFSFDVGQLAMLYDSSVLLDIVGSTVTGAIRAGEGHSKSFIISEPSLLVKSGATGELVVGQEIPVRLSESVDKSGQVVDTRIERTSVGVKLSVTPTVKDGFIDLVVNQEISSIDREQSDAVDIITNTERLSTSLTLSPGQTAVIGGLKVASIENDEQGVPFFRGIPIVGNLFGSKAKNIESQNIVLSITASLMDDVTALN